MVLGPVIKLRDETRHVNGNWTQADRCELGFYVFLRPSVIER